MDVVHFLVVEKGKMEKKCIAIANKGFFHHKKLMLWVLIGNVSKSTTTNVDWLQSLKQFFINVSYHILVASLTLMALFLNREWLCFCFKTEPSE